jgi:hypothetical protein
VRLFRFTRQKTSKKRSHHLSIAIRLDIPREARAHIVKVTTQGSPEKGPVKESLISPLVTAYTDAHPEPKKTAAIKAASISRSGFTPNSFRPSAGPTCRTADNMITPKYADLDNHFIT